MEQYPTDRNRWEIELTEDDNFWIERRGWPVLTEKEQWLFDRLESWHQAFFLSLSRHQRVKSSLEKAAISDSSAERLSMHSAFIREYQLRPIMKICHVSTLVFPLIEYDTERRILEDEIISAIEYWGMKAGGLNWQDMHGNLAASEDDQWKEYTKESLKNKRENFLYAAVNIHDLDELAKSNALHWRAVKYLRVWRYFLQDLNKTANVPPLSQVSLLIHNNGNTTDQQPIQPQQPPPQPTTIETPTTTDTPDGLPIPWLMKKPERVTRLPYKLVDAAYRLFRQENQRNPENCIELFNLLTPEKLPDLVVWRNTQSKAIHVKLTLVGNLSYDYERFRSNALKKFK